MCINHVHCKRNIMVNIDVVRACAHVIVDSSLILSSYVRFTSYDCYELSINKLRIKARTRCCVDTVNCYVNIVCHQWMLNFLIALMIRMNGIIIYVENPPL